MKKNINIMLIGLGPHSKRIYLNYLKNNNLTPTIIVDLESKKEESEEYIKTNNLNSKLILIPDQYKDLETLPPEYETYLLSICNHYHITHIISSTEPKAHNMYLTFALKNNINILSDKPITVTKDMHKLENINKLKTDYQRLANLYRTKTCLCKIMCQRAYHRGYQYIKDLLASIIKEYNIPITYIDIFHCDGNWEMPHDLDKENHPYKYGYGKLFHSGYHFIDLLSELIKLNNYTTHDKLLTHGNIYGSAFTPNDETAVFNKADYQRFFNTPYPPVYSNLSNTKFPNYGEKNFYGLLNFYNEQNSLITTANLNLLHYGFSRRGWFPSRNYYKENGRVRHERLNIEVGPLLNIQVHSYQSKEIKDRKDYYGETLTGGLEHFDIDIYRNVDLIGGIPFERITLRDLYKEELDCNTFIGFNEQSRSQFIHDFLNNPNCKSDLLDHELGIEILFNATKTIYDKNNGKTPLEEFTIPQRSK